MKKAAKILMIISAICCFWCVFPLVIGIKNVKRINNNIPLTTKNKVIVLLFCNTLAGILLLCDKSDAEVAA